MGTAGASKEGITLQGDRMRVTIGSGRDTCRPTAGRRQETTVWLNTVGLIVTLALSILAVPLAAEARQVRKIPKIGVLMLGSPPASPDWKQHSLFLQELRTLGWVESQNVSAEYRWAHGRFERLDALAVELVRLNVDVIVAADTPAIQAVTRATPTIPIVMLYVGDPVADGLIASLARPGGNVTGVGGLVPELNGKLLELLKEAVPHVTRMAVLVNPVNPMTASILGDVERAAQVLGVQLHVLEVGHAEAFEPAFDTAIREGAGALLVLPAILFTYYQRRIAALAAKSRLPAIYWQRPFVEAGGLMVYGPRMSDLWRRVAALVDKVLRGAKPADLPVEQPRQFELVINLKTAQVLGLTLPPTLLFQADEVIR